MKKTKQKFKHLDQKKRDRLEALLNENTTQVQAAVVLKVDKSTVSREIRKRRKKSGYYDSEVAQVKANLKRANSKYQGMKIEKHPDLRRRVVKELKAGRSPDEIAGMLKNEKAPIVIGTNAIYKWLYSSYGQSYCKYLCTRRYKKKPQRKTINREMIPNRISIDKRPKTRGLVHTEGDTLVSGKKSKSKAAASLVAVKKTKLLLGNRLDNLKPKTMETSIVEIQTKAAIDTLTLDNGIENKSHESFGIPTYFCDPHAPWQKPLVEQSIGLLRRWCIKKGTDLASVSEEEYQAMLHYLNHKKRKSLGYRSAYEESFRSGIIKTLPSEKVAFHPRI